MVAAMSKEPSRAPGLADDPAEQLRVIDNFPMEIPVTPAELDAIEAFLMPVVNELLSGGILSPKAKDSEVPQTSARWEARL